MLGAQKGRVEALHPDGLGGLFVAIGSRSLPATNALPFYAPREGDVVLVLADLDAELHIVGVLEAPSAPRLMETAGGHCLRAPEGELGLEAHGQAVRLGRDGLALTARAIRAVARTAELASERAVLSAEKLETTIDRATQRARVLEVHAERIVERARDTYREVEELAQLRAGRIRYAAAGALSMVGRHALVKARATLKLRGERIHLA